MVNNHMVSKPPRKGHVMPPLPNGVKLAYKSGLLTTCELLLILTWTYPPSSPVAKKGLPTRSLTASLSLKKWGGGGLAEYEFLLGFGNC